jgi:predicted DNA-binding antitoxin AbrB/MazE fold protein
MRREVEAVYENGVLRPLEPLLLNESQRVRIVVSELTPAERLLDQTVLAEAKVEVAMMQFKPTIEEVRAALSPIRGCLSEVVIDEREDY